MDAARLQLGGTPIALADGKRSVPSTPDVHEGLGAREDTGSSAGGAVGLCPALLHGAVAPGGSSPFRRIRNQRKRAMTVVRSGGLVVAAFGLAFYMWASGSDDREFLSDVSDRLVEPAGGGAALSARELSEANPAPPSEPLVSALSGSRVALHDTEHVGVTERPTAVLQLAQRVASPIVALDVTPARADFRTEVRSAEASHDERLVRRVLAAGEAQTPNAVRPPAAATEPKLDPAALIARGNEFLLQSDVVSARLFYRLAATRGSAAGAVAMGGTYDPVSLEHNGVRGVKPDPDTALDWYRRAGELGDSDAKTRIAQLLDNLRIAAARGDPQARAILQNWAR